MIAKLPFRPMGDRVLIEPEKQITRAGLLIIPEAYRDKQQAGTVVKVGAGKRDKKGKMVEMHLKIGDNVYFPKFAGAEITVEGKQFLLMREDEIIGVID